MKDRLGQVQASPKRSRRSSARKATALSLVEVLLAVMLGALATSAVAVVSVQVVRSRRDAEATVNSRWVRYGVLAQFRQDVDSRVRSVPAMIPTIRFPEDPSKVVEITALTLVSSSSPSVGGRVPAKITYLSEPDPRQPNLRRLVRRVEPLVEILPPRRDDVLIEGLDILAVERLEGATWVDSGSAQKGNEPNTATAVRLRVHSVHSKTGEDVATMALTNDLKGRLRGVRN